MYLPKSLRNKMYLFILACLFPFTDSSCCRTEEFRKRHLPIVNEETDVIPPVDRKSTIRWASPLARIWFYNNRRNNFPQQHDPPREIHLQDTISQPAKPILKSTANSNLNTPYSTYSQSFYLLISSTHAEMNRKQELINSLFF